MYTYFSTLSADAQGFICWGKGVLSVCDKEELRQDRSCSSPLLCFLPFGSPVSGAGVVLCLLQFWGGGEHMAGVWGWTRSPLQSVHLVCNKERHGMLSCSLYASGGFRGAALSPFLTESLCCCTGLGTPGHSFELCFLPVKMLVKGIQLHPCGCIAVGALTEPLKRLFSFTFPNTSWMCQWCELRCNCWHNVL